MKTIKPIYYLVLVLFLGAIPNLSKAAFAELIYLNHDCGNGGSVGFELLEGSGPYTYSWNDNVVELERSGLAPGIYTLRVENFYGCVEEYEIEILSLLGCTISSQVLFSFDPCVAFIHISVKTDTGQDIDENALNIVWQDGDPSGLERQVHLAASGNYCVTITVGDNACCVLNECVQINASPNCNENCEGEFLVNETNKNYDGDGQFLEILVTGKCKCEDRTDLRGVIIDDNNGYLIPGNDWVNAFNAEQSIGISPGYLVFSQNPVWSQVPNGSLIVVYDVRNGSIPNLPADDPTDTDLDGVYVLQASDSNYFYGKEGNWDVNEKMTNYSGSLTVNDWNLVFQNDSDGFQLRNPDGTFHHGLSTGTTTFMADNEFPMWLSNTEMNGANIQFTGTNNLDKNDFSILDAAVLSQTPGLANSPENNDLRESLRDCNYTPLFGEHPEDSYGKFDAAKTNRFNLESIKAYPNPFTSKIFIEFNSSLEGTSKLRLSTITGQAILEKDIATLKGINQTGIELNASMPAGVLILELIFPSGIRNSIKLTHLQAD